MGGFNFERNLPHQNAAIASIMGVFEGLTVRRNPMPAMRTVSNPEIVDDTGLQFGINIKQVQDGQGIFKGALRIHNPKSHVLDISMETGTGKTYTYAKAMFELNRGYGIAKFVVVVPTLSIKAGTVSFLRSETARQHFKQDYHQILKVHVVESRKSRGKNKKSYMPQAVREFVEALNNPAHIHVLVINAGMINSDTMRKVFDQQLFDKHSTPFDALASVKPFTIIDEPHKFKQGNKTWENIQRFDSQYIIRFGATFDDQYENLIHELTAVDAFNQDLVKGIVTYVEEFEGGKDCAVTLKSTNGTEAVFELKSSGKVSRHKLIKRADMGTIHAAMRGLFIERMNRTTVVFSNGLELKTGHTINPYSYAESMQDKMMASAVRRHFEFERKYLTRSPRIKPLTLFFIDDIEGYRAGHQITGSLKARFEALVKAEAKAMLETEADPFYKAWLKKTLQDLSLVHGGYFSKDNADSDEKIEQEVIEILHDKETLLSMENPRRFIFSKWTLREGWDNPNVFQICKLRSSGSETSKLQEVGRGLRLPVNEYMSRVKDERFDLHYCVDFTERNFTERLVGEINSKSGVSEQDTKLTDEMIQRILAVYPHLNEDGVLETLDNAGAIKRNNDFREGGLEILQAAYPLAVIPMIALKQNKIRSGNKRTRKATMRVAKYSELKALWETINQRVVLEYKIASEAAFAELLKSFFLDKQELFKPQGSLTRQRRIEFHNRAAFARDENEIDTEILPIATMSYKAFTLELSRVLSVNLETLHLVFAEIQQELDINYYLSPVTIRAIRGEFQKYLLDQSFCKYQIAYSKVSNAIHPTVFTDETGKPMPQVDAANMGRQLDSSISPADAYLFEEVFYDSDLERENIVADVNEVTVFTKIPKNSIRIPVSGGGTYSPDFAYVVAYENEQKTLNLIVETKGKEKRALDQDEKQKIKHAEKLFNSFDHGLKVSFKAQFAKEKVKNIIKNVLSSRINNGSHPS